MASYIPASYAGRDFDTRSAAYNQQWSNDDCLSSNFTTESKSYKKIRAELGTERQAAGNRAFKPAMSEKDIEARITEIQEKRKKNKLARAAAAQGGAPHMSQAQLNAERAYHNELVRQATKAFKEASESGNQAVIDSTKLAMLAAKLERSKLDGVNSTGNTSGKKKKKSRPKLTLDKEEENELARIVSEHKTAVRQALTDADSHADYSQKLHDEFVAFATARAEFYETFVKKSSAQMKRAKIARASVAKCEAREVDQSVWEEKAFDEFREIIETYKTELDRINADIRKPEVQRTTERKQKRDSKNKSVSDLIARYNYGSRRRMA